MIKHIYITFLFLGLNYKFFYAIAMTEPLFILFYELLIYFILFLFLTYIFSFDKVIHRLWLIVLIFSGLISVYFVNTLGIEFNKQIINNAVQSNMEETMELLGLSFIYYILFIIILFAVILYTLIIPMKRVKFSRCIFSLFVLISLFFSISKIDEPRYKKIIKNDTPKVMPLGLLSAMGHYIRTKSRDEKISKKNISKAFNYISPKEGIRISVLVIGESARADRFTLNGYKKDTTPLLKKVQNLSSFSHASSCDTSTLSSVPCMLLRVEQKEFRFPVKESSFVQIFTDHGIDTYWLSLQNEANTIHTFCTEASSCINRDNLVYDKEILEEVQNIIVHANKDTLIVLHTMGSHMNYNKRVPLAFQNFQPICEGAIENCDNTLDNSYDNTIYYTDSFLTDLIGLLEDKNAFLLYTSDHGESLGEAYLGVLKRYGHASPYDIAPAAQTNIPFIVWFSTYFGELHPSVKKIDTTMNISHDYIYHTMLGCAGFRGEYLKDTLNLCSKK